MYCQYVDNTYQMETTGQIKVSKTTNPKNAAGAIASLVREGKTKITTVVIGAGALNQAIKSIAIARGYIAANGKDLSIIPSFTETEVGGTEVSALYLVVEVKDL